MANPTPIVSIDSKSAFDQLLADNKHVVVDFWATWCGPCKAIAPFYAQQAATYAKPGQLAFAKVDVDNVPDVAARYAIANIPTFMIIKEGEKYGEELKGPTPPKLKAAIENVAAEVAKSGAADNDIAKAIEDEDW